MRIRLAVVAATVAAASVVPAAAHAGPATCTPDGARSFPVLCQPAVPRYLVSTGTPEQVWQLSWVNPLYLKLGECPQIQQPGHIVDWSLSWMNRTADSFPRWLKAFRNLEYPGKAAH
jgi:hypothetical protein